jgi:hypothetical protein
MAKKKKEVGAIPIWVLGGAAGLAFALYYLFKPSEEGPGQTEAAPLPPLEMPSEFESVGAVATAFDNLKTNWRMGRLEARETWDRTTDLIAALQVLEARGVGDATAIANLVDDIAQLRDDIADYVELTDVV